jgi:hypothetical protein
MKRSWIGLSFLTAVAVVDLGCGSPCEGARDRITKRYEECDFPITEDPEAEGKSGEIVCSAGDAAYLAAGGRRLRQVQRGLPSLTRPCGGLLAVRGPARRARVRATRVPASTVASVLHPGRRVWHQIHGHDINVRES